LYWKEEAKTGNNRQQSKNTFGCDLGSISPTLYEQLLLEKIPKAKNALMT